MRKNTSLLHKKNREIFDNNYTLLPITEIYKTIDAVLHCTTSPAFLERLHNVFTSREEWFYYGKLHRKDGPALTYWTNKSGPRYEWWKNGKQI